MWLCFDDIVFCLQLSQDDIPFREDVDILATINQLNHTTIPLLIRDVIEEGKELFFLLSENNRLFYYIGRWCE